ncbi:hypothetical protein AB0E08_42970 [Streptomyces sp. NPDC048281]|uniref:hypothetical protein n=1 Tax=Streptomyces sp. NPDC048281 TaxID=3154715 RepID=UPI00343088AA
MTSNSRVVVSGAGRADDRRPVPRPGEHAGTPATPEAPETPEASVGGEERRPYGRLPLAGATAHPTLPLRSRFSPFSLFSLFSLFSPLPNDGGS